MDWNEIIRIFIIMWFSYLMVDTIFRSIFTGKKAKEKLLYI